MALQDLTPQLRTRLSRVEKLVGAFVFLAGVLLVSGLGYYLYHTAQKKGWFLERVPYFTILEDVSGLKVGDPVRMMGFTVGEIDFIEQMPPDSLPGNNVFVKFHIKEPYYGYLWIDSSARVTGGEIFGNRTLEVTRGTRGPATVLETNKISFGKKRRAVLGILSEDHKTYRSLLPNDQGYYLPPDESVNYAARAEKLLNVLEKAVPDILAMTNQINGVLTNISSLTKKLEGTATEFGPVITNLVTITDKLSQKEGALGEWLFAAEARADLEKTFKTANTTLESVDKNLTDVATELDKALEDLAGIMASLRKQVESNPQILESISKLVVDTDDMVQGLKRHWLLRRAFRKKVESGPKEPVRPPAQVREGKLPPRK